MPGRLVTIGRYGTIIDAQLAKSALEAAGIQAVIIGENTAANFHHHVMSIPLAVDEDDAETAEQIVNAMLGVAHAEHIVDAPEIEERCERCGSPEIARRQKLPAFVLFAALTFGIGAAVDNTLAAFYIFLAGI